MKTIFPTIVIAILALVTLVGIFSVPSDDLPISQWLLVFWLTKSIGFGAGYASYRLINTQKQ